MSGAHTQTAPKQTIETYDLLADALRRNILVELGGGDGPVHVDELADALVDRDEGIPQGRDGRGRTRSTVVELHHCHLPKLDEAGWLEYDAEEMIVRYDENDSDVPARLETAKRELERIQSTFV